MVIDYLSYEEKKMGSQKLGSQELGSQKLGRKAQAYASALLWTLTGTSMATKSY